MPNIYGLEERRFGISTLSKSKRNTAYDEELLGDKYTGELLFKSPDKDFVSFNYNARVHDFIESTEIQAKLNGLFGQVYTIENDGQFVFPAVVPFATNILDTSVTIGTNAKKFMLRIDLDCLTCVEEQISTVKDTPSIQFDITIRDSELTAHSLIKEVKLTDLQQTVYTIPSIIGADKEVNEIIINSIKVVNNIDMATDLSAYRLIMYGICVAVA